MSHLRCLTMPDEVTALLEMHKTECPIGLVAAYVARVKTLRDISNIVQAASRIMC
jgi:hypothetical protein